MTNFPFLSIRNSLWESATPPSLSYVHFQLTQIPFFLLCSGYKKHNKSKCRSWQQMDLIMRAATCGQVHWPCVHLGRCIGHASNDNKFHKAKEEASRMEQSGGRKRKKPESKGRRRFTCCPLAPSCGQQQKVFRKQTVERQQQQQKQLQQHLQQQQLEAFSHFVLAKYL